MEFVYFYFRVFCVIKFFCKAHQRELIDSVFCTELGFKSCNYTYCSLIFKMGMKACLIFFIRFGSYKKPVLRIRIRYPVLFLTPGSGIRDGKKSRSRIRDEHPR
jgi:hypothetical protein